ncbi:MAG: DNA-binding response regulator [Citrobacter freundii]|nr:MAG: DNA-binding response regulator [Citrobacter freundii]
MSTTIIIADDHPMLAEGVSRIIEELDDIKVIAIVSNGRQLQDKLVEFPVDMLLLDLNMPGLDGLSLLPLLKKDFPKLKILVYTSYDEPGLVRKVKQLGANGYMLKVRGASVIKEAVLRVSNGGSWFDEAGKSMQETPHYFSDEFTARYQITKREAEIIRLVLQGKTTREIGETLFVSEFTVNAHRRNISRKLNVNTVAGLVQFAKEHGFL